LSKSSRIKPGEHIITSLHTLWSLHTGALPTLRLGGLDDGGGPRPPRDQLRGQQEGVDEAATGAVLLLAVDSSVVAFVEVERVAERVVPEVPGARAAAPPHPLAQAPAAAAAADEAAHGGA